MPEHTAAKSFSERQSLQADEVHPLVDLTALKIGLAEQMSSFACFGKVLNDSCSLRKDCAILKLEHGVSEGETSWNLLGEFLFQD